MSLAKIHRETTGEFGVLEHQPSTDPTLLLRLVKKMDWTNLPPYLPTYPDTYSR